MVTGLRVKGNKDIEMMFEYKGEICGKITLETDKFPTGLLHFDVSKFNHGILKQMKRDMAGLILPCFKAMGFKQLLVSSGENKYNEGDRDKWERFIKHFGFPESEVFHISAMEI